MTTVRQWEREAIGERTRDALSHQSRSEVACQRPDSVNDPQPRRTRGAVKLAAGRPLFRRQPIRK
jgi:hypothetical protein